MVFDRTYFAISLLSLATLVSTKPIMVSFGTNQGPIVPRLPKSTTAQEGTLGAENPAPVSEDREDVPNPVQYVPPMPHQYRTKLYSFKIPTNLILGTPVDQKYTPSLQKYNLHKKQYARNLNIGVDYTGPHMFEKQDYDIYARKTTLQPSVRYNKPHYYQHFATRSDDNLYGNTKYVPQIGVIYSSGIRYYIPQIFDNSQKTELKNPEDENSVYDREDGKYY